MVSTRGRLASSMCCSAPDVLGADAEYNELLSYFITDLISRFCFIILIFILSAYLIGKIERPGRGVRSLTESG